MAAQGEHVDGDEQELGIRFRVKIGGRAPVHSPAEWSRLLIRLVLLPVQLPHTVHLRACSESTRIHCAPIYCQPVAEFNGSFPLRLSSQSPQPGVAQHEAHPELDIYALRHHTSLKLSCPSLRSQISTWIRPHGARDRPSSLLTATGSRPFSISRPNLAFNAARGLLESIRNDL